MRKTFSFTGAKKIIFGNGSLLTLAIHIKELHAQNPLVVIDKNLAKTGLLERVASILVSEGIKFTVYDKVDPEPGIELADAGAKIALKQMRYGHRYRRRQCHGCGQSYFSVGDQQGQRC